MEHWGSGAEVLSVDGDFETEYGVRNHRVCPGIQNQKKRTAVQWNKFVERASRRARRCCAYLWGCERGQSSLESVCNGRASSGIARLGEHGGFYGYIARKTPSCYGGMR